MADQFSLSRTLCINEVRAEIMRRPFRRAIKGMSAEGWRAIVSIALAPTWALDRLVPERPVDADVLCAGLGLGAFDGGAWLALLARLTHKPIQYTLLQRRQPIAKRANRTVLAQRPPRHIDTLPHSLDQAVRAKSFGLLLVAPCLSRIFATLGTMETASFALPDKALLVAANSHARMTIIIHALRAMGYDADAPRRLSPDLPEGTLNLWWVRVRLDSLEGRLALHPLDESHIHLADEAVECAYSSSDRALSLSWAGREISIECDSDERAVVMTAQRAIGLQSGHFLVLSSVPDVARPDGSTGAEPSKALKTSERISSAALSSYPSYSGIESMFSADWISIRAQRLNWISKALLGGTVVVPENDVGVRRENFDAERFDRDVSSDCAFLPMPPSVIRCLGGVIEDDGAGSTLERAMTLISSWISNYGFDPLADVPYVAQRQLGSEYRALLCAETGGVAIALDDYRTSTSRDFHRTEVTIRQRGDKVHYSVRQSVIVLTGGVHDLRPPEPPSFIDAFLDDLGACALRAPPELAFSAHPIHVSPSSYRSVTDFLLDPERISIVVVLGASKTREVPDGLGDVALLHGMAHLLVADGALCTHITDCLPAGLGILPGMIRIYGSEIALRSAPPDHPTIDLSSGQTTGSMVEFIKDHVHALSSRHSKLEQLIPCFDTSVSAILSASRLSEKTRRKASDQERHASELALGLTKGELEAAQSTIAQQAQQLATTQKAIQQVEAPLLAHIERLREERGEALKGMSRLEHRWAAQWKTGDDSVAPEVDEPESATSWAALPGWVEGHLNGDVVLHANALRDTSRLSNSLVGLSCRTLHMLANYYIPMRKRGSSDPGPRHLCDARSAALGVEITPVGSAIGDRRYALSYQREFDGQRHAMDLHVKRGVAFDPESIFRLYFTYDAVSGRVLVGHLPTHLVSTHSR